MFYPLEYEERMVIVRGVMIFVIVIILGINVTQEQLNSLTERQERIVAISIPRDQQGIYSFYFLGSNYDVQGVYPVGQIITTERSLVIRSRGHILEVPVYIEINCKKELGMLELWARLLVKKALQWKQATEGYVLMIHERINVYARQFR